MLDKLLIQRRLPPHLVEQMLRMVDDSKQGVVWRDYVLQKFPNAIERISGDDFLTDKMLKTLWTMVQSTEHTFSGTALLALERLSRNQETSISIDRLATESIKVAESEFFTPVNRQTALQVGVLSGAGDGAVALARKWLADETLPVGMSLSAMNTLGQAGSRQDGVLLKRFASSGDVRIRKAARLSLKQLQSR